MATVLENVGFVEGEGLFLHELALGEGVLGSLLKEIESLETQWRPCMRSLSFWTVAGS